MEPKITWLKLKIAVGLVRFIETETGPTLVFCTPVALIARLTRSVLLLQWQVLNITEPVINGQKVIILFGEDRSNNKSYNSRFDTDAVDDEQGSFSAVDAHILAVLVQSVLKHIHRCCDCSVLWRVIPVVDDSTGEECLPCCY